MFETEVCKIKGSKMSLIKKLPTSSKVNKIAKCLIEFFL